MFPNKILLIEDDPAVAHSLQEGLEREGFAVTWKETGTGGVEHARRNDPSLIILDLRLPDGSGFDFCQQIRQLGLHQPILMLTVQREELDRVLGLEVGADDYLTKPFSLRELVARVRAQLRRAYGRYSAAQSELLFVHDLAIDLALGQARRGETILPLTPIEFRLLAYLARHRGLALSRAQIIEAVWGYAPDLDSERAINVHIRRLREKIEPNPSRPTIILTVPGIGYRLAG
jgi:DNA-binding response OmpR family regulator